jgi:hypothetical protein
MPHNVKNIIVCKMINVFYSLWILIVNIVIFYNVWSFVLIKILIQIFKIICYILNFFSNKIYDFSQNILNKPNDQILWKSQQH